MALLLEAINGCCLFDCQEWEWPKKKKLLADNAGYAEKKVSEYLLSLVRWRLA